MIIVDSSVWIAFLSRRSAANWRSVARARFRELLAGEEGQTILMHPFVMGELVLGGLTRERKTLLDGFTPATVASLDEVLHLIEGSLVGRGVGYTDAHLLASARLMRARLWMLDPRLASAAAEHGCGF